MCTQLYIIIICRSNNHFQDLILYNFCSKRKSTSSKPKKRKSTSPRKGAKRKTSKGKKKKTKTSRKTAKKSEEKGSAGGGGSNKGISIFQISSDPSDRLQQLLYFLLRVQLAPSNSLNSKLACKSPFVFKTVFAQSLFDTTFAKLFNLTTADINWNFL